MTRTSPSRHLLITGASSGIGAALARHYAANGWRLSLSGRDETRLDAIREVCHQAGAQVTARALDVTGKNTMAQWIDEADHLQPLDLVIANAGISGGMSRGLDADEQLRLIFAVNLDGVLNTTLPAIAAMRRHGRGQIAVMSSLAGYRGMPGATAYSASKAAVKAYGEGLRGQLAGDGIRVSVICPGFVESRITDANDFTMPFLMPADRAAGRIARELERNRALIAFPWQMHLGIKLLSVLPSGWGTALMSRLPAKE